jgi:hypothetical protein
MMNIRARAILGLLAWTLTAPLAHADLCDQNPLDPEYLRLTDLGIGFTKIDRCNSAPGHRDECHPVGNRIYYMKELTHDASADIRDALTKDLDTFKIEPQMFSAEKSKLQIPLGESIPAAKGDFQNANIQ